jgi:hypothetical protein
VPVVHYSDFPDFSHGGHSANPEDFLNEIPEKSPEICTRIPYYFCVGKLGSFAILGHNGAPHRPVAGKKLSVGCHVSGKRRNYFPDNAGFYGYFCFVVVEQGKAILNGALAGGQG